MIRWGAISKHRSDASKTQTVNHEIGRGLGMVTMTGSDGRKPIAFNLRFDKEPVDTAH